MDNSLKRTPLYDLHVEHGAKLVEFAGWEMPIQYPLGIMAEHKHCRTKAALFDVSHMGQVILKGDSVAEKLEKLVPAALTELPKGKARYTFFTNDQGGILDDLIVSNAGDYLFLVINASMRDQDIAHLKDHLENVELTEIADHALIAVQGPMAEKVLSNLAPDVSDLKFMETTEVEVEGTFCRVSRLGYTGEDGFEISIPQEAAEHITRVLLSDPNCEFVGLGARDSLRMEAGLCLYGNDIDTDTTPIEASLLWAIQKRRRADGGFPGAKIIQTQIENGAQQKLVGIKPEGRAPARRGVEILSENGDLIGKVTSGGFGPTIEGPIAMGYIATEHAELGSKISLLVRNKEIPAEIVKLPFVKQNYKR